MPSALPESATWDVRVSSFADSLRLALLTQGPLLHLSCGDEDRLLPILETLAERMPPSPWQVYVWSCTRGWRLAGTPVEARPEWARPTTDPCEALLSVLTGPPRSLFVLTDLIPHLRDPRSVRAVRDLYYDLQGDHGRLVISIGLDAELPPPLDREVCAVNVAPPQAEELAELVAKLRPDVLEPALESVLLQALEGLALDEVRAVLRRLAAAGAQDEASLLSVVFQARTQGASQAGALEFVPPRWSCDQIGGLERLKDWLRTRHDLFKPEAVAAGLPTPRGILLMGVSGCGKSYAAKSVSALWQVPLLRLDMNLVFSGLEGSPEATFHRALRAVEGLAPVVLWIDEIENGLSFRGPESQQHLFSVFLTWLQEKPPLVFVAATANRIEDLPAELLRKGRFDQVFFCDLPTANERHKIFEIHLAANGADPSDFRLDLLVHVTRGWSGAEIEQAVVAARVDAYRARHPFGERELLKAAEQVVPLSRTMREQIRAQREWSYGRATRASSEEPVSLAT